jgi:hypothetical protein
MHTGASKNMPQISKGLEDTGKTVMCTHSRDRQDGEVSVEQTVSESETSGRVGHCERMYVGFFVCWKVRGMQFVRIKGLYHGFCVRMRGDQMQPVFIYSLGSKRSAAQQPSQRPANSRLALTTTSSRKRICAGLGNKRHPKSLLVIDADANFMKLDGRDF